jgi:uncharacterized protein
MKNLRNIVIIFLVFSGFVFGQDIPQRPTPPRLVNDFTGTLSEQQSDNLERKLVTFFDTTGNQITIVIVPSLNGYDKSEYAYAIGEKWGVGKKEFDNGVVVLVKPKTTSERGEAFIATGYGLEGAIPDAISKRIVEQEMIPRFKQNDYYGGLNAATNVLMALAAGEYSANQYKESSGKNDLGFLVPIIVMIIIILMMRKNRNDHFTTGSGRKGSSLPFWTAMWLGSTMGGSSGSSWGGSSGGFGGGGGGFGGFGGGSFGGGGAGGSW